MKSLSKLALCLLLAMSLTVSAFAAQVPDSLVAENLNGQQRLVKTYTLSPEVDPNELKEEDFSYDGYLYTVVYTGSEIVPVKTHIWDNDSLAAPLLIIAAVLLCAGIAAVALILLRRRKNVYVYVPDSKPREYRLIAKFRVEPDSEVPAIDAGSLTLNPGDTVAVEVKKSLARHLAGREFTVSFPQSDHTYTIQASKHNDWHEFTVPAEEEQEAPV